MSKRASATSTEQASAESPVPGEDESRRLYLEYRALSEQARRMQRYLDQTGQSITELSGVKESLGAFGELRAGERVLAPIASGIFIDATLRSPGVLHMNVGAGAVVAKTVPQAQAIVAKQITELEALREKAGKDFAKLLEQLQRIEARVNEN